MVPAGGASRTKVFTATWPSFVTESKAHDGTRVGRRGAGNQHNGPRCQVEIRTVSTDSAEDALIPGGASSGWLEGGDFPEDDGVDGDGGDDNVVFLNPSLLLRRYNSVSLADEGVYRLTLSDCYGFVAAPSVTPAIGGGHPDGDEEFGAETARLLFLSLPLSLDFEINDQVSSGEGLEIGGFQLVPVVYMPPPPPPPPPLQQLVVPSSLKLERAHVADGSEIFNTPPPDPLSSSPLSSISTGTLRSSAGEYGGGGRASFNGRLVSGAVVGVVAVVSMVWLMVARGWGRGTWEKLSNGAGGRDGGRKKEGRPLDAGAGGAAGADEGGRSDADSSDSDTILRGHVPDPVGLPRSDEDWRALFDTLYEDEKD